MTLGSRIRWAGALGALMGSASAGAQSAVPSRSAFVGVNVVDVARGRILPNQVVLVANGRIVRVGPADSVIVDSLVPTIDGGGAFLMPGLADLHVHLRRPEEFDLYLAAGVTTVQFLNAFDEGLQWADEIARGIRRGPTVFACAGPINGVADSLAAETVVADAAGRGFRCIKPYGNMTEVGYRVLVAAARHRGIRTVSHIPRELTWQQMLQVQPSAVAHAEEFLYSPIESQADIDSIVSGMQRGGIGLVTTLINYDLISRQLLELPDLLRDPGLATYSPVFRRAWSPAMNRYVAMDRPGLLRDFRRLLTFQRGLVRRMDSAGTRILLGTDTGNNFVLPGRSVHDELLQLVVAGLTPAAALRSATTNAAAFLGETGEWGAVTVGARADLVLVAGNPLTDITNSRLTVGVMRLGVWHPRAELDGWLAALQAGYQIEADMVDIVDRDGVTSALQFVEEAGNRLGRPPVGVFALNELGYQFWRLQDDPGAARRIFELNRRLYPDDPMTAEALEELRAGGRP